MGWWGEEGRREGGRDKRGAEVQALGAHTGFLLGLQASPRDPDNFPFVVLGNKIDLPNRAVCLFFKAAQRHVSSA